MVSPTFVLKPIAQGELVDPADTFIFLSEFRVMSEKPQPERLSRSLAHLHKRSQSSNGKFGFGITTYAGNLPQAVNWKSSWEVFFTKGLQRAIDLEIGDKGSEK